MRITNLLKVTEDDTIGSAIIKKATEGYVKAAFTGLVGLGMITVGVMKLNDMANNSPEEEVEDELTEDEKLEAFEEQRDNIKEKYGQTESEEVSK